ncbi:GerMN domain-containing protein [Candidatus Giovannonibacteria bacterium]|nr:GerMN domain-containing protein [Candidatus Giovannonibacteria bacterium]
MRNLTWILIGILIIIAVLVGIWYFVTRGNLNPVAVNNFNECTARGYPVMESYPRQCRTPDGKTFSEDIGNAIEKQDLIRVTSPRPNQVVKSPFVLEGEARGYWYFEASFPFRLEDSTGNVERSGIVQAKSEWMTENFVPFREVVDFRFRNPGPGKIILNKDNPSGKPENDDQLVIPVIFENASEQTNQNSAEKVKVKVFFGNNKEDPQVNDCNKVFAVEREIPKTTAVGRAALEQLLRGPTLSEKEAGYFSSINDGVLIQWLLIENGVAKVDFDEQMEYQVGGSCRVAAIRSQITETLKQFPTVKSVSISINGRTEDILQP